MRKIAELFAVLTLTSLSGMAFSAIPMAEKIALVALYNSTDGTNGSYGVIGSNNVAP